MTNNWWYAHSLNDKQLVVRPLVAGTGTGCKSQKARPKAKRLGQEPEGKDGKVWHAHQGLSLLQRIVVLNQEVLRHGHCI